LEGEARDALELVSRLKDGASKLSVTELCQQLLEGQSLTQVLSIPSLDAIGEGSSSVDGLGDQRRRHLKRVLEPLLSALCMQ